MYWRVVRVEDARALRLLGMKGGVPPTARKARTGELTPPGVTARARASRAADAGASVGVVAAVVVSVTGAIIPAASGAAAAGRRESAAGGRSVGPAVGSAAPAQQLVGRGGVSGVGVADGLHRLAHGRELLGGQDVDEVAPHAGHVHLRRTRRSPRGPRR